MHKCRSYGPEKLSLRPFNNSTFKFDRNLQPINLPQQMFQMALLLLKGEQLCQIIFKSMHKCISNGPDKLKLRPFYHLIFKCDLNLQPTLGGEGVNFDKEPKYDIFGGWGWGGGRGGWGEGIGVSSQQEEVQSKKSKWVFPI